MEHLSVPQTLGRVFKIVCCNWITFFQLAAAAVLPLFLIILGSVFLFLEVLGRELLHIVQRSGKDGIDWKEIQKVFIDSSGALGLILVGGTVLSVVVTMCGRAAMCRATAELYASNDTPEAGTCLQKAFWQFCELIMAGIVMQGSVLFIVTLPFFLIIHDFLILGVFAYVVAPFVAYYVNIRLSLVVPAIVVEDSCSGLGGIRRSWNLTSGAFCDIFCANLLFGVLFGVVLAAASKFLDATSDHVNFEVVLFIAVLILSLPNFFFMPCSTALQTVIYMNRRIRVEGMTHEALVRDIRADSDGTFDANPMAEPLLLGEESLQIVDEGAENIGEGEQAKVTVVADAQEIV